MWLELRRQDHDGDRALPRWQVTADKSEQTAAGSPDIIGELPCPRRPFALGYDWVGGTNDATSRIGSFMGGAHLRTDDCRYRDVPDRLLHDRGSPGVP